MELFQKIEALIGRKMETYPAEQEAVLMLLERVGEAQRIATMQVSCEMQIAKCVEAYLWCELCAACRSTCL